MLTDNGDTNGKYHWRHWRRGMNQGRLNLSGRGKRGNPTNWRPTGFSLTTQISCYSFLNVQLGICLGPEYSSQPPRGIFWPLALGRCIEQMKQACLSCLWFEISNIWTIFFQVTWFPVQCTTCSVWAPCARGWVQLATPVPSSPCPGRLMPSTPCTTSCAAHKWSPWRIPT